MDFEESDGCGIKPETLFHTPLVFEEIVYLVVSYEQNGPIG